MSENKNENKEYLFPTYRVKLLITTELPFW